MAGFLVFYYIRVHSNSTYFVLISLIFTAQVLGLVIPTFTYTEI